MQQSNENKILSDTPNKGRMLRLNLRKVQPRIAAQKRPDHDSQPKSKRIENSSNTNKVASSKMEKASKIGGNSPKNHGKGSKGGAKKTQDVPIFWL